MKIAVLMGGDSEEREISLKTGAAVIAGLKKSNYETLSFDFSISKHTYFMQILQDEQVDIIFNALHGSYGENGVIQSALDMAEIPYTGSNALSSSLAMNKNVSKLLFSQHGVPTAAWININSTPADFDLGEDEIIHKVGLPVIVKPNSQGSTIGLSLVKQKEDLKKAIQKAQSYDNNVLIEKYIAGRELTVPILANRPLPIIEIVPEHGIYDYSCKYTKGKSTYHVPAELPASLESKMKDRAMAAFNLLHCKDYARVDFRLNSENEFFCLEVNTLPGMTELSLVPMAAQEAGITFDQLVKTIVELALEK